MDPDIIYIKTTPRISDTYSDPLTTPSSRMFPKQPNQKPWLSPRVIGCFRSQSLNSSGKMGSFGKLVTNGVKQIRQQSKQIVPPTGKFQQFQLSTNAQQLGGFAKFEAQSMQVIPPISSNSGSEIRSHQLKLLPVKAPWSTPRQSSMSDDLRCDHRSGSSNCPKPSNDLLTDRQSQPSKGGNYTPSPSLHLQRENPGGINVVGSHGFKFPQILWNLLQNATVKDSIHWNPDGTGFVIDHDEFEKEYLSSAPTSVSSASDSTSSATVLSSAAEKAHFKTFKITSFVRQLNLYGFRKVKKALSDEQRVYLNSKKTKRDGKIVMLREYRHVNFRRNARNLLKKVVRRSKHKGSFTDLDMSSSSKQAQVCKPTLPQLQLFAGNFPNEPINRVNDSNNAVQELAEPHKNSCDLGHNLQCHPSQKLEVCDIPHQKSTNNFPIVTNAVSTSLHRFVNPAEITHINSSQNSVNAPCATMANPVAMTSTSLGNFVDGSSIQDPPGANYSSCNYPASVFVQQTGPPVTQFNVANFSQLQYDGATSGEIMPADVIMTEGAKSNQMGTMEWPVQSGYTSFSICDRSIQRAPNAKLLAANPTQISHSSEKQVNAQDQAVTLNDTSDFNPNCSTYSSVQLSNFNVRSFNQYVNPVQAMPLQTSRSEDSCTDDSHVVITSRSRGSLEEQYNPANFVIPQGPVTALTKPGLSWQPSPLPSNALEMPPLCDASIFMGPCGSIYPEYAYNAKLTLVSDPDILRPANFHLLDHLMPMSQDALQIVNELNCDYATETGSLWGEDFFDRWLPRGEWGFGNNSCSKDDVLDLETPIPDKTAQMNDLLGYPQHDGGFPIQKRNFVDKSCKKSNVLNCGNPNFENLNEMNEWLDKNGHILDQGINVPVTTQVKTCEDRVDNPFERDHTGRKVDQSFGVNQNAMAYSNKAIRSAGYPSTNEKFCPNYPMQGQPVMTQSANTYVAQPLNLDNRLANRNAWAGFHKGQYDQPETSVVAAVRQDLDEAAHRCQVSWHIQ